MEEERIAEPLIRTECNEILLVQRECSHKVGDRLSFTFSAQKYHDWASCVRRCSFQIIQLLFEITEGVLLNEQHIHSALVTHRTQHGESAGRFVTTSRRNGEAIVVINETLRVGGSVNRMCVDLMQDSVLLWLEHRHLFSIQHGRRFQ